MFQSINPYTHEVIATYEALHENELISIIERTHKSYQNWKEISFDERGKKFLKLAEILRNNIQEYARLITSEMGKPIKETLAEVEKCAGLCEYYAHNAEEILKTENVPTDASKSYIRIDPIGIIYAIMPWNFPFWQVFRAAVPNIMAGNTMILKHAPNVFGCATAIEQLFLETGFPENVFSNVIIDVDLSEKIIAHPAVQGVTLTGSMKAGSVVAAQAGKHIKKSVLELGGSDPYIVLKDAEINQACKIGTSSRMMNAGQVCISAKRFIVHEAIYEQFIEEQKALLQSLKLGDPMQLETEMGPMAREDLVGNIDRQVKESVSMGAQLIMGGKRVKEGWFYEPTLLTQVSPNMPVYKEETFGPVSVIIKAKDEKEMIRIANDTRMGLGASIWTQDIELAEKMAQQIESGAIFINGMTKSDPRLPFGGIKESGYGRELGSYGIKEFVNIKTVWVK